MKKIKYKILIICLSIKWMFRINLGDWVIYKNNKYIVCNGVRCDSWRLGALENGHEGWVLRKECKKVRTIKNMMGSYYFGYQFYMTNWYDIWVRSGIELWMKRCKIW